MRIGAGSGAGFDVSTHQIKSTKPQMLTASVQLDDQEDVDVDEMIRLLRRSIEILEEQRHEADPRFLKNAKQKMKGVLKWARNIEQHNSRRTLPKTNAQGSREGTAAVDIIGYRYQERL